MHTYTYTYTHAYIYIYTCLYTYIHEHTYTHSYNMYICTHASTSETTARQRLRGKPDLTPRSSTLLPVRCNLEVDHPFVAISPIARPRGTMDKRRTNTTNSSSSHHHDSAPPRPQPLICTGAEPIHPVRPSWSHGGEPPKRGYVSAILAGFQNRGEKERAHTGMCFV